MTFGQKLRELRIKKNITQKDLADKLHVSFQTISKWENDTTEPDLATIREISKTLNCSFDYLLNEEDTPIEDNQQEENKASIYVKHCIDCGKDITNDLSSHQVTRKKDGQIISVDICDECYKRQKTEADRKASEIDYEMDQDSTTKSKRKNLFENIISRNDKVPLIWSLVIGAIVLIVAAALCINFQSQLGVGYAILIPIIASFTTIATIYCIFTESYISDVFSTVASWSIQLPGLIFTFDLDGFLWLIGMKILFAIIGFLVGVTTFVLALTIAAILSIFSFIPLLIYNKKNYINLD